MANRGRAHTHAIRARMAQTGENYTTAMRAIERQAQTDESTPERTGSDEPPDHPAA